REVISTPPAGKPPLFIMLDGTWPEARKMFRKSPYLDHLPVISMDEAEQCRDVLLMNEGELLYQGEPKALTQTMAGRSFLMSSPQ
ncbi:DTW domain-containing protein, partial [Salmonella enterica subsp. enterica serovar Anatum]|nr:DTW domain-containing protein [Salmonella enterica subsp. enterica serovar Anatum]